MNQPYSPANARTAVSEQPVVVVTRRSPDDELPAEAVVLDKREMRIDRVFRRGCAMSDEDRMWPGRIRRLARAALLSWGLAGISDTVVLLMTELVTNALQHGRDEVIGVRLYRTACVVGIEVVASAPEALPLRPRDLLDESGRGLTLIDALAERWGVSDDRSRTWCTVSARPAGAGE